ncbi:hypothetical protein ARMGADRAFT_1038050 [Armillaria gallica]|uniref:Uncharacterized protein n=1 Tax=Armillaria gallica TaxID=47427 RepID=A0A2H3CXP9_ARMGA|nr:hypothetical protein ARMGADRAFT_1038050 [Armillaria gallica]
MACLDTLLHSSYTRFLRGLAGMHYHRVIGDIVVGMVFPSYSPDDVDFKNRYVAIPYASSSLEVFSLRMVFYGYTMVDQKTTVTFNYVFILDGAFPTGVSMVPSPPSYSSIAYEQESCTERRPGNLCFRIIPDFFLTSTRLKPIPSASYLSINYCTNSYPFRIKSSLHDGSLKYDDGDVRKQKGNQATYWNKASKGDAGIADEYFPVSRNPESMCTSQ